MITWPPRDGSVRDAFAAPAAVLSLGAAAIHFAVIGEHLRELLLFGILFVLVAWFQAWWAVQYVARPTRRLEWLALALNLGVIAVWTWSRTMGLPIGPASGTPEEVGTADVIATVFELALVALLVEVIRLGVWDRATRPARVAAAAALAVQVGTVALVILGTTIALAALATQMAVV